MRRPVCNMEAKSLVARRHPCGSVRVGNGVWETAVQRDRSLDTISRGVARSLQCRTVKK